MRMVGPTDHRLILKTVQQANIWALFEAAASQVIFNNNPTEKYEGKGGNTGN
jgi:hypothetical protein